MRVSDQIVNQIQCQIVDGSLAGGQKLPNETELSQQFGVSRASVREALSMLESRGVVERHKSGGTFLCGCCLEKILAMIDIPRERNNELAGDLTEARGIVECSAGELACERADNLDLKKIRKTLDMMQQNLERGESGLRADLLFHQCVAMAAKNEVVAGLVRSLGTASDEMRGKALSGPGSLRECLEDHRAIYAAIAERDPQKCAALMKKHFSRFSAAEEPAPRCPDSRPEKNFS